jgi:calcyclin binding protein
MVSVEEVPTDDEKKERAEAVSPSEERLLDAEEIEKAATSVKRPTARMHLEALAKKLRKESEALKRVEKSREMAGSVGTEEKKEDSSSSAKPPAAATPRPVVPAVPPAVSSSLKYVPIDRFAFDAGGYNAPFVTLYVDLPGVGSIDRDKVSCDFTKSSFDLVVKDLRGKSYRLCKDSLEKDIDPEKSKVVVKADKILVKLAKVKGDYGYDYWSKVCVYCVFTLLLAWRISLTRITLFFVFSAAHGGQEKEGKNQGRSTKVYHGTHERHVRRRRRQHETHDRRDHDEATARRIGEGQGAGRHG